MKVLTRCVWQQRLTAACERAMPDRVAVKAVAQAKYSTSIHMTEQKKVAVIGGGLSGAACAHQLSSLGIQTSIFDMGFRGPGGRASTRYHEGFQFDHGCQFLRLGSNPQTSKLIKELQCAGVIAPWTAQIGCIDARTHQYTAPTSTEQPGDFCGSQSGDELYVGTPGMDAICRHLTSRPAITMHWGCKVLGIEKAANESWSVRAEQKKSHAASAPVTYSQFDAVVLADIMLVQEGTPGCIDLGAAKNSDIITQMLAVGKRPIMALMAGYPSSELREVPFDAAVVSGSNSVQWICNDSSKPGQRQSDACWIALSTSTFATDIILAPSNRSQFFKNEAQGPEELPPFASTLLRELTSILEPFVGHKLPPPLFLNAHRWGAAFKTDLLNVPCLLDSQLNLAACGDFCLESSAEGALSSGLGAAAAICKCLEC